MNKSVFLIEARSQLTQSAYYVDTIDGKELYSFNPNDAKQFNHSANATVIASKLDTENIRHEVIEHIFE